MLTILFFFINKYTTLFFGKVVLHKLRHHDTNFYRRKKN